MESVMQRNVNVCYVCHMPAHWKNGIYDALEEHHIFGGSNRKHSEAYGLKVYLHGAECHRLGRNAVHTNAEVRERLQREAQKKFEAVYGHKKFMEVFGKNYL